MIIDCHGHYTTEPGQLGVFRDKQLAGLADGNRRPTSTDLGITDDQIRATIEGAQRKQQKERGTDLTIFSPRAAGMAHHVGTEATSQQWTRLCNDLIHRVVGLFPQSFIGCNLNPDPSGGYWQDPALTARYWYPIYEKMVELDVPAMVHVSSSCNPAVHATGAHYINGDTTAFMQFIQNGDKLFKDFPTLRFIIPHGGGAVPYHWGRYRGLAQDMNKPTFEELMLKHVYFDTCVYHQPGINLLTEVVPIDNILFASEMVGAVKGVDPRTGHNYDDTKRYVDGLKVSAADRAKIFEGNAHKVFPRLAAQYKKNNAKA